MHVQSLKLQTFVSAIFNSLNNIIVAYYYYYHYYWFIMHLFITLLFYFIVLASQLNLQLINYKHIVTFYKYYKCYYTLILILLAFLMAFCITQLIYLSFSDMSYKLSIVFLFIFWMSNGLVCIFNSISIIIVLFKYAVIFAFQILESNIHYKYYFIQLNFLYS